MAHACSSCPKSFNRHWRYSRDVLTNDIPICIRILDILSNDTAILCLRRLNIRYIKKFHYCQCCDTSFQAATLATDLERYKLPMLKSKLGRFDILFDSLLFYLTDILSIVLSSLYDKRDGIFITKCLKLALF